MDMRPGALSWRPFPPGDTVWTPDGAFYADEVGVDLFAEAMKAKLAEKRSAGRSGWNDPDETPVEDLARMFVGHLAKGDMVDIGNFAMMLHHREGGAQALAELIKGNIK